MAASSTTNLADALVPTGRGAVPYTAKAERFFQGCKHNPAHMKGKCPDEGFLEKYGHEKKAKVEGQKKALRSMR